MTYAKNRRLFAGAFTFTIAFSQVASAARSAGETMGGRQGGPSPRSNTYITVNGNQSGPHAYPVDNTFSTAVGDTSFSDDTFKPDMSIVLNNACDTDADGKGITRNTGLCAPDMRPRALASYTAVSQALGVPAPLLMCLTKQESQFTPGAVSPVGASGFNQFMPETAREFETKFSNYRADWDRYREFGGTDKDPSAFVAGNIATAICEEKKSGPPSAKPSVPPRTEAAAAAASPSAPRAPVNLPGGPHAAPKADGGAAPTNSDAGTPVPVRNCDPNRAKDMENFDVQIFATGMYFREMLANPQVSAKLREFAEKGLYGEIYNYLLASYNGGQARGEDYLRSGITALPDETKGYIRNINNCLMGSRIPGSPNPILQQTASNMKQVGK